MARILHVVNSFDPAGDVTRCVQQLEAFSEHKHELIVKETHPNQNVYQFPGNETYPQWHVEFLLNEWCDAVLYHFVGWENGWNSIGDGKPCGFRNSNVYFDSLTNRFWAAGEFNARSLGKYKLLASSHMGAVDFLPGCKHLPAMVPIFDPRYMPDFSPRLPCVSYSKQWELFDKADFGSVKKLRISNDAHDFILKERKHKATIVIDNIAEGHYGLAGFEAMSLGLPFIVFNQKKTRTQLLEMADEYPPLIEVNPNVKDVVQAVLNTDAEALRIPCRQWMEKYYNPERLIKRYWEPFFEELLS